MAINNAIQMLGVVLLAGLTAPAMNAQGASDSTISGNQVALATAAPALMSQGPAKTPKVTCAGDQLTISANNATLGSVLAAVHACIGIQIDIPEGAGKSRTFEELGPGPERQVLEALLSGTDFNYVIGSSDADPGKVETVLLMERTKETAANGSAAERSLLQGRHGWMEAVRNPKRANAAVDDNTQSADESSEAPVAEEPVSPPAAAENANAVPTPATDAPVPTADAPPAQVIPTDGAALTTTGSPAPELAPSVGLASDTGKSTADRISSMQQLFEQRKQINQSQSSASSQQ